LLFSNETRNPDSAMITAKLVIASAPPNMGGTEYDEESVPNLKEYATKWALPMVVKILRESQLSIREVWRLS